MADVIQVAANLQEYLSDNLYFRKQKCQKYLLSCIFYSFGHDFMKSVIYVRDFMQSIISWYHNMVNWSKTTSNHNPNPVRTQSGVPNPNDSVLEFGRRNLWSDRQSAWI